MKSFRARALVVIVSLLALNCGSSSENAVQAKPDAASNDAASADAGSAEANQRALTMNDVSVLFPLSKATSTKLWAATMEGRGGPLLPRSVFAQIGRSLMKEVQTPDGEYAALRVVSARIDPCFPAPLCQPQVRLVMQGIDIAAARAFDGALHALYNLTSEDFASLTTSLRNLSAMAPENVAFAPLGPSPAMTAQGIDGPYGSGLKAILAKYIGSASLARLTFMTRTDARQGQWEFGGINVQSFAPLGPIDIPGLQNDVRLQTVNSGNIGAYHYTTSPVAVSDRLIGNILTAQAADAVTSSDRAAALESLARIQNPLATSSETVDCVMCHLTNRIRAYFDEAHPSTIAPANDYLGRSEALRLIGGAERAADNLRAFGYFDSVASVSQRTANETHAVLKALSL